MTEHAMSRRLFLEGTVMLAACTAVRAYALNQQVTPRMRVILDNDFSGDPDGLFQAAHHLLSPSVDIPFIIGSHIHKKDFLDPSNAQAEHAVQMVRRLYGAIELKREPPVLAGRESAGSDAVGESEAARRIVAEAMRDDTRLPLYYAAGAGLTDLAEALRIEPRIAPRIRLVWIGGMEYTELVSNQTQPSHLEYNATIDIPAVQSIFAQPDLDIWQVPRDCYRSMIISLSELETRLQPSGELGKFLLGEIRRVQSAIDDNLGETYILGDSPLVTLTALQSSFEADSSSSSYVYRTRPRISNDLKYLHQGEGKPIRVYQQIDRRVTFEDMFMKFNISGRHSA
jgi:purine nucleosidase